MDLPLIWEYIKSSFGYCHYVNDDSTRRRCEYYSLLPAIQLALLNDFTVKVQQILSCAPFCITIS